MAIKKQYEKLKMRAGVSIRKHKTKDNIQISFPFKGKTKRKTLDIPVSQKNIGYAENVRGEYLNQIERNIFDEDDFDGRKGQSLIKNLLIEYKNNEKIRVKASAYTTYRKHANTSIKFFGEIRISDLKATDIIEFIKSKNCTLKSITNLLIPMKKICREAYTAEKIKKNPFDLVDIKEYVATSKQETNTEIDPFEYSEINLIIDAACDGLKHMIIFAFFSGLRLGELFALKWIDITGTTLHVCRSVTEKVEGTTKTGSSNRKIKLQPLAIKALKNQKFISGDKEYVFCHPTTFKNFIDDKLFREGLWMKLLKKVDVRYRCPRNCRHTFASMMLSSGENLLWLSKYLGHKNVATTLKHYATFIPGKKDSIGDEAMKQFNLAQSKKKNAA